MKNFIRFIVSAALVFAFFFNGLPGVKACGPFTIDPLFSLTKHADYPLFEYTNGKIGIVPASFGQMSLFVFYRYLNNSSLTKAEQNRVVATMENRIGAYQGDGEDSQNEDSPAETPDYFAKWIAARAKVVGGETKIETEKRVPDEYNYFSNCLQDTFNNATKTLEARVSRYDAGENVKEWIKGQDTVFSNCGGSKILPESLSDNSPEWLRQDRQYQIAAAQFYSGDFAGARENFEKIAVDESSVWNKTAKFVVARTYIRQASFVADSGDEAAKAQAEKEKSEFLQKAEMQLQDILADNSAGDFHKSANRLLALVKYRLIPRERAQELAKILMQASENQNIYNDLTDYVWLLENTESQAREKGSEIDRKQAEKEGKEYDYNYKLKLRDVSADERQDDLTDWLFTYQAADGFAHAFEKWKESGKLQWLIAAIADADANAPQVAEILSEADKIPPASAAFATVRFHQIRLLLETGKRAEARQKLDEIFSNNLKNFPVSTQNKFLAQRLSLAANLDEFLKFAQRKAAIFVWSDDGSEQGSDLKDDKELSVWKNRTMFDADSVAFFNEKMPLSVLRQAALSPQLPEHLKKFLVAAVWTRAFVLGNQAVETEFAPLMSRSAKEFAPLFSKYANASNATNREAAALIAILRYPVIEPYIPVGFGREVSLPTTIDSNRGNWWCAEQQSDKDAGHYDQYPFIYPEVYPNFLTADQATTAEREHKQIISLGNSATFLANRAVAFANRNPSHPQTPEILHLAVRSTRYGCTDDDTGKISKQAFQILHKRYPNSAWTRKTPFWFGGL